LPASGAGFSLPFQHASYLLPERTGSQYQFLLCGLSDGIEQVGFNVCGE
jgi:hypothetical protein